MHYANLTVAQQRLCDKAEQAEDITVFLRQTDALAADKAAVAELLGGEDAGAEFLR
ncbi:hypothetical protein [Actinoplanes sp. URMC 104]|uniref:hypothetical protein n=1 Tax=Actinoplanes sp. URMC 104 TaxID=3423409 RepID=UPI003F1CE1E6